MWVLVSRNKLFAYLEMRSIYFSTGHPWLPRASVVRFPLRWNCSSIQRTQNHFGKELHSSIYSIPHSSTALWPQTNHRGVGRILVQWANQISRSHEIRPSKPNPSPNQYIFDYRSSSMEWGSCRLWWVGRAQRWAYRDFPYNLSFLLAVLFILPVRDAGYIRPGTFLVASSMEWGQAYCLSSAILGSIYRGLGEICRSAHLGRKGGHIPWHFLYAWVAKYFRTYDFDDNVSSNKECQNSVVGRTKHLILTKHVSSSVLGGVFAGILL